MKGALLVVWVQNILEFIAFAGGRVLLTPYALLCLGGYLCTVDAKGARSA